MRGFGGMSTTGPGAWEISQQGMRVQAARVLVVAWGTGVLAVAHEKA